MSHKQIFTNNITKRKIGRKKTYFSGKLKTKMTIWIFVLILIAGFDILFKPFGFLDPKHLNDLFSNLTAVRVADKGFMRNVSCTLNQISTLLWDIYIIEIYSS